MVTVMGKKERGTLGIVLCILKIGEFFILRRMEIGI